MKKAFTTAELLISLMVIGVIAALVIPVFTKDYNTRIRTAAIKDSYATIMSAIQRACADKNVTYFSHTGYMDNDQIPTFLRTYFRGKAGDFFASSYKPIGGNYDRVLQSTEGIPKNNYYKMQNGAALAISCPKNITYQPYTYILNSSGNYIFGQAEQQMVCNFYIDTNGKSKPNIPGLDIFKFTIGSNSNNVVVIDNTMYCIKSVNYFGQNCVYQLIRNDWNLDNLQNSKEKSNITF